MPTRPSASACSPPGKNPIRSFVLQYLQYLSNPPQKIVGELGFEDDALVSLYTESPTTTIRSHNHRPTSNNQHPTPPDCTQLYHFQLEFSTNRKRTCSLGELCTGNWEPRISDKRLRERKCNGTWPLARCCGLLPDFERSRNGPHQHNLTQPPTRPKSLLIRKFISDFVLTKLVGIFYG